MSFLNPLYYAAAWVIIKIHAGLAFFLPQTSGAQNSVAWVLSIIILVIAVRLLLLPLFIKQMHSMRKMAALAPHMNELRKKYKGDRQTLNEETMKLYQEHGVNPLGGCLPLVAQLPLFFALFQVLRTIASYNPALHGKNAPLTYGLTSKLILSAQRADILGAKLGDKVLSTSTSVSVKVIIVFFVLISVLTTYLTVRQSTKRGMTPQMTPDNPMASSQKIMSNIVPLFALSGLFWAFGLVLYWVTTNVWTLTQQHVLFQRYPAPVIQAPDTLGGGKAGTTLAATASKPKTEPGKGPAAAAPGKRPLTGTPKTAIVTAPVVATKPGSSGTAANGSGLLRRLRNRAEEAEPAVAPEVKIVRQQPSRTSRSKRSGKH